MTTNELERYLREHIPLSAAMQVAVVALNFDEVVLQAPLGPNINHRETVFGGSASALAILAAWSLLHFRLRSSGIVARLVIQRNNMAYDRPVTGTFSARAFWQEDGDEWQRFTRILSRRGRARTSVSSVLLQNGVVAGRFSGEFVALTVTEPAAKT